MPPEDLSREIDRLWSRLGTAPVDSPAPLPPPAGGAEVAWETVAMMKQQQRRRESSWTELLEAKEQSLRQWRAKAEALQAEVLELRSKVEGSEELSLAQATDLFRKLQDASRALELERSLHEQERSRLEAALEESRAALTEEARRSREAEALWAKRERQSLQDLKDVQTAADRRQKEAAQADETARALKGSLAEAKNALEKTLAELLLERQERSRVEGERAKALQKADEIQRHFDELQKLWEEERAQWRELWDRERSTWEAQRQELAQWEESLRREREAWHAELQQKEKSHLDLTDGLTGKIRETTQAAELVAERMRQLEGREELDRARQERDAADLREAEAARRARRSRAGKAVLAVPRGWEWARAWRFETVSVAPIAELNPAALGWDGTTLWVADWNGRLTAHDPSDPRRAARQSGIGATPPLRPTALAFGGNLAWALDAAQARIVRLNAARPDAPGETRPSPGPAPTALAYDGAAVWSYDAANRALYRHGGDEASYKAFPLKDEIVPNAMLWVEGRLWIHDTKTRTLRVYESVEGEMRRVESHPAPDASLLGLAVLPGVRERTVWALAAPGPERSQAALIRYSLKRRLPFADF
jgi:hypothetical protein